MRKISSNDALMTTREVGEVLGVAVRTVQLWVESGALPAWRTAGGHRRIARSAVDRLIRERTDMLASVVQGTPEQAVSEPQNRALRLLVVEDDPDLRQLFSMVVEGWNFPVELGTAMDGFQGLVRIGQWMPDMVVTDLNMPGMNGFEMVRSLRSAGAPYAGLQIVAVTALSACDVADRGGLPQGTAVFQKPVDFAAIETLARSRQATLS
jgi:excisionase family DNA binding protein